jgi:lipoate-protein ligase A
MRQYRLIHDPPTCGSRNMAVDEAIMTAVSEGKSPPTLRLYAWVPPCLSLGYNQGWANSVDMDRIKARGWQIVRRPTGGRAILHTGELTYSIAVPADHPLVAGGIVESYQRISQGLRAALNRLGLEPNAESHTGGAKSTNPVCFEVPSDYEITTPDGRKLIGSAQTRRKGVVLQHGSLPLTGDVARICDALYYPDEAAREQAKIGVRNRAATLADFLNGEPVSWQTAADAVTCGFTDVFGFSFELSSLTPEESAHVESLVEEVYANPDWTFRK